MTTDETSKCITVLMTAEGRGAVASLMVRGADSVRHIERFFSSASGRPLSQFPLNRIIFGNWQLSDGNQEQTVVCRRAPDIAEVHCHGGNLAAESIIGSLQSVGVQSKDWETWLLQDDSDPIAAEARIALAGAQTERTAAILLDQLNGALRAAIESIVALVNSNRIQRAIDDLDRLLAMSEAGRHLAQPCKVVLAGPPNSGKSSLINALVGYQRSIVYDLPGTTRDILTASTAIDGWPVVLSDTAGIRPTDEALEAAGVMQTRRELADADLIVLVTDRSQPWTEQEELLLSACPSSVLVHNKADLTFHGSHRPPGLLTSALHGTGIDELITNLGGRLVPAPPASGTAVPFTERQIRLIELARTRLSAGNSRAAVDLVGQLLKRQSIGD